MMNNLSSQPKTLCDCAIGELIFINKSTHCWKDDYEAIHLKKNDNVLIIKKTVLASHWQFVTVLSKFGMINIDGNHKVT
jgi:hypothetical protein